MDMTDMFLTGLEADTTAEGGEEMDFVADESGADTTADEGGLLSAGGAKDGAGEQDGADYDRIRAGYDDIKGEAYRLRELAAASGKSVSELLDDLAAGQKSARVNDTKAKLLADGADGADGKIAESIHKLIDVYGVHELPEEVVKISVDRGLPPFEAYQAWKIEEAQAEVARLQQRLSAEKKNAANAAKGVGSLAGGADGAEGDPFLLGLAMD